MPFDDCNKQAQFFKASTMKSKKCHYLVVVAVVGGGGVSIHLIFCVKILFWQSQSQGSVACDNER